MKIVFVLTLMFLSGLIGYHFGKTSQEAAISTAFKEGMYEARALENGRCKYCGSQYPTKDPYK